MGQSSRRKKMIEAFDREERAAREAARTAAATESTTLRAPAPIDAMSLGQASWRAVLAARGLDPNIASEERLHPPRAPIDPEVAAAAATYQAEVQRKRADYFASLGTFDARDASPEECADRLQALGIGTAWDRAAFREKPAEVQTTTPVSPHDAAANARMAAMKAARTSLVTKQLNAQRAQRPLDVRSLTDAEFAIYRQMRGLA